MTKYRVKCYSLVTRIMERVFTVSANNEREAVSKAQDKFFKAAQRQLYTDVGGDILIDSIERID